MIVSSIFRSIALTVKKVFLTESVIAAVIVANSLLLFLMGFDEVKNDGVLDFIDHSFTVFFVFEVLVKLQEKSWKGYIADAGNKFDFFLVAISVPSLVEIFVVLPDVSYLLAFRLLRVLRILRFMRFIPNLNKMLVGIKRAFKASVFVMLALFIFNVLLAILSNHLFKSAAPEYFGNPLISLYSVFQIFTLEGWYEIPDAIIAHEQTGSWLAGFARLYFPLITLTGGILGFSIVNAIFVDEMTMDNNVELEDKIDALNKKVDQLIKNQER
ncbi:MAG: ion transporter [Cytophagales bacterium]|nr:ion transporter [Cytophagales bacterium]